MGTSSFSKKGAAYYPHSYVTWTQKRALGVSIVHQHKPTECILQRHIFGLHNQRMD